MPRLLLGSEMWLTIAYDRKLDQCWLCTIAQTEQEALDAMNPDRRAMDHLAINFMRGSFEQQVRDWALGLGVPDWDARVMGKRLVALILASTDDNVKTAHSRN